MASDILLPLLLRTGGSCSWSELMMRLLVGEVIWGRLVSWECRDCDRSMRIDLGSMLVMFRSLLLGRSDPSHSLSLLRLRFAGLVFCFPKVKNFVGLDFSGFVGSADLTDIAFWALATDNPALSLNAAK